MYEQDLARSVRLRIEWKWELNLKVIEKKSSWQS